MQIRGTHNDDLSDRNRVSNIRLIYFSFSFRRYGQLEKYRIPILCIKMGERTLYVCESKVCSEKFQSYSLSELKRKIWVDIRKAGD